MKHDLLKTGRQFRDSCLSFGPTTFTMLTLFHHPLCPFSRFARLAITEFGLTADLVEERPWDRRVEFLTLNPAGTTPVLVEDGAPPVPDARIIAEYLDETRGADLGEHRLLPREIGARIEVRRLCGWFHDKFAAEVSVPLTVERIFKRHMPRNSGRRAAGYLRHPCGAREHPLSSGLCRMAGAHARLAGGRAHELCRSGGGGASVGGGLFG